jgi:hypothetical protein
MLTTAPVMATHAISTCARTGRLLTVDSNVIALPDAIGAWS